MGLRLKKYYNYVTDFLLLYAFISIAISGFILWFALPRGQGIRDLTYCDRYLTGWGIGGNAWTAFGLPRYLWVELHSWIGVIAAILVIIHLLLHWRWIVESTKRIKDYILKAHKASLEHYTTALVLFTLTAFQVLSGCVIWLIIPRGAGDFYRMKSGVGRTFWGLQRNEWLDLHAWISAAMLAIIIAHVIMHWRWIVNMTLGKRQVVRGEEKERMEKVKEIDKPSSTSWPGQASYLPRAGMFIGLVGAICFLVMMLTLQLDHVGRYEFMLYLIPTPLIILMLARKWPYIGGALLIVTGIAAVLMDINYTIGIAYHAVGVGDPKGIGFTLVFVTFPLIVSGVLFLLPEIMRVKINKNE